MTEGYWISLTSWYRASFYDKKNILRKSPKSWPAERYDGLSSSPGVSSGLVNSAEWKQQEGRWSEIFSSKSQKIYSLPCLPFAFIADWQNVSNVSVIMIYITSDNNGTSIIIVDRNRDREDPAIYILFILDNFWSIIMVNINNCLIIMTQTFPLGPNAQTWKYFNLFSYILSIFLCHGEAGDNISKW